MAYDDRDDATREILSFDEVVRILQDECGHLVAFSISTSPVSTDADGVIASFGGTLELVGDSLFREGELDLRIDLRPLPSALVTLNGNTFVRAVLEFDDPATLTVWQRGVIFSMTLFSGPPALEGHETAESSDGIELPF